MYSLALSAVAVLAALLPTTLAQTHTKCFPLNTTGCPDMPALGGNATFNFNDTMNIQIWEKMNAGDVKRTLNGTAFSIKYRGDAPYVQSNFYLFFGRIEVVMRSAPGQGIVSSAILQSEDLDEIDWEFLGSNTTHVLTNYYGKGNRTDDPTRGKDFKVDFNPQEDFHNYTLDWTKERIQWWLDGKMLRELKFDEALGGKNYPQTPMNIRMGAWAGGDTENNPKGTVDWAGGETDFSKGPYAMLVQNVYAKDYTSAKTYSWADMDASGSFDKVKVIKLEEGEKSETIKEVESPHGVDRFKTLSKEAKIGIAGGVVGFVVIAACLIAFCCIKQRRAGRREYNAYQAGADKEAADLIQHKQEWAQSHRASRYTRI